MANTERMAYLHEVRHGFITVSPWDGPGQKAHASRRHIPMTPDVSLLMIEGESRKCLLTLPEELATLYKMGAPISRVSDSDNAGDNAMTTRALASGPGEVAYRVNQLFKPNGDMLAVTINRAYETIVHPVEADPRLTKTDTFSNQHEAETYRRGLIDSWRRTMEDRARSEAAKVQAAAGSSQTGALRPSTSLSPKEKTLSKLAVPSLEDQLSAAVQETFNREGHTLG